MDYEKKIEKLRNPYVRGNEGCSVSMIDLLEKINEIVDVLNGVPELRESDDERIRKGLVKLLTVASDAYLVESTGIKKDSYLAWLEKKKEQIPLMNGDADLYFDNWIQHNNPTKRECFEAGMTYLHRLLDEQKEQNPEVDESTKRLNENWMKQYFDEQQEQKPAEWSEKDDQIIGFIFDLLNDLFWRKDWAISKEECLERLKSLRPSWKSSDQDELMKLKYAGTSTKLD